MNEEMRARIHEFLQYEDNIDALREWFFESRYAEEISNDTTLSEQEITAKLHRVFKDDLEQIAIDYFEETEK